MLIKTSKPECIWKTKSSLGEGTLWVPKLNSLFFVDIKKLPVNLENALEHLSSNEMLLSSLGEKNITSYLKLKQQELKDFNSKETFSKKEPITEWEKINTLDC